MTQPEDVAQPIEVAAHQAASAIAHLQQLTFSVPPQMPLVEDSSITKQPHQLMSNYNNVDSDQQRSGTDIRDIIAYAYIA